MLRNVNEIAIDNMNWEQANKITEILVNNGYAVMTTLEENLIIVNYVYASTYDCKQANRNNVVFMSEDSYYDMRREEQAELEEEQKWDRNERD